jgi:two-component system phosphate regulon response regulator OmpR
MPLTHLNHRRVLLAEDDASLREVLTQSLVEEGFEVTAAANGAAARRRVQNFQPDVILLDMNMPVMDGPTFAERYRQLPVRHAPIVAVTAAGAAYQWAERIKAAAWLNKPFDFSALMRLLNRLPSATSA